MIPSQYNPWYVPVPFTAREVDINPRPSMDSDTEENSE